MGAGPRCREMGGRPGLLSEPRRLSHLPEQLSWALGHLPSRSGWETSGELIAGLCMARGGPGHGQGRGLAMGGRGQAGAPGEGADAEVLFRGKGQGPQTPASWCERCLSLGEISAWLGHCLRGPAVPLLLELSLSPAFMATRPPDLASWLTCRGLPLACLSHLVAVTESYTRGKA